MSHAILAGTAYKSVKIKSSHVLTLCIIGSIIPDADVLGFQFGISYADMLGHRGFTHSILFAIIYAFSCLLFFLKEEKKTKIKLFFLFFFSIMSHGFLDMLTNGGLGVGLFIPWTEERYFFPLTPIEVSPIGAHFFSKRGATVILNELLFIWLPCALVQIVFKLKKLIYT